MCFILTRNEIAHWEKWIQGRFAAPGVAALVSEMGKYGLKYPISARATAPPTFSFFIGDP
jgi:hypothetical protein